MGNRGGYLVYDVLLFVNDVPKDANLQKRLEKVDFCCIFAHDLK